MKSEHYRIYRGDDSDAFDQRIVCTINGTVDYSGCSGIFLLCGETQDIVVSSQNDFTILIDAQKSEKMPTGVFDARLKVFDAEGRAKTLDQKWRFEILHTVIDSSPTISVLSKAVCGVAILGRA